VNGELCSKCKTEVSLNYHRYCSQCKNLDQNQRVNAKGGHWNALTPEQKHKAVVRKYAYNLVKRGKLIPKPCEVCGREPSEIHHLDYTPKSLNIKWLCDEHHVEAEREKRNLPKAHQLKWMPDPRRANVLERMASKSLVTEDGCWLWTEYIECEHAKISLNRKMVSVHRLSWEIFNGPIPDGMWVLHKCVGHGNCWNPHHLYLGNSLKNAQDRVKQGRDADRSGSKNGRAILTIDQIAWIRRKYEPNSKKGMNTVRMAKILGVSQSTVYSIVSNATWKKPIDSTATVL